MANQPAKGTVTVCFTLPKALAQAVDQLAIRELTNKSDIIRRALLAYLSPEERNAILGLVLAEKTNEYKTAPSKPRKPRA